MLGRVFPQQLFPTERQSTFTKKANHLHELGSISDAGFPSRWSHSGTTTWARILENGDSICQAPGLPRDARHIGCGPPPTPLCLLTTELLQLNFFPRRPASPRKITEVSETHRGAFRVSYKASWNRPAVNWPLTFQAESSGSTEELAQNKGARKQVYGLRNLSESKATSFLDGLSQPDSVLSAWGFLCCLVFYFLFSSPCFKTPTRWQMLPIYFHPMVY